MSGKSNRPPSKILDEIGWLSVQWAKLETTLELPCAHLFKANLNNATGEQPPKAFKQRLKYLRKQLNKPLFVHLRAEFIAVLDDIISLSDRRNTLIHSTFADWTTEHSTTFTTIKTDAGGYTAYLDQPITLEHICDLTEHVEQAFRSVINLGDRLNCLIRAFNLDHNFQRKIILRD
jgi:hypothetical protein